jgi:RNA polymerase sigma factor (sigma-70 family)
MSRATKILLTTKNDGSKMPDEMSIPDLNTVQDLIKMVVNKMVGRRVGREEFEDIVQDVNVRMVARGIPSYKEEKTKFTTWTYMIAKQVVIEHIRASKRNISTIELDEGVACALPTVLYHVIKNEQRDLLKEVISTLSTQEYDLLDFGVSGHLNDYAHFLGIDYRYACLKYMKLRQKIARLLKDKSRGSV